MIRRYHLAIAIGADIIPELIKMSSETGALDLFLPEQPSSRANRT
jgi:hypothetical protein